MKRLTSAPAIIATALLLACFSGCGKYGFHKEAPKPPPPATVRRPPVDPRDIIVPGFTFSRNLYGPIRTNTLLVPDGTLYQGEVSGDGIPNGRGHLLDPRGTDQRGEWHHGQIYRIYGTWVGPDGIKEIGSWNRDGTRSGGTIFYTNGWKYVGDWRVTEGEEDIPNGMGMITSPVGDSYAGEFHNGEIDGAGKMLYVNGKVQVGYWRHNKYIGETPPPN